MASSTPPCPPGSPSCGVQLPVCLPSGSRRQFFLQQRILRLPVRREGAPRGGWLTRVLPVYAQLETPPPQMLASHETPPPDPFPASIAAPFLPLPPPFLRLRVCPLPRLFTGKCRSCMRMHLPPRERLATPHGGPRERALEAPLPSDAQASTFWRGPLISCLLGSPLCRASFSNRRLL
ncbi:hypothetical protein cyc_09345 [Cyclospora cayetanensis]|uniref:Uncharacterized protein n=1 Tax=Cyclospora cayetanensis TaxID=88456 RepID=A0A1D3CXK8_9EIME|nr:hypothetical protein cyc_09345 [Cyclospora cayetanensis]